MNEASEKSDLSAQKLLFFSQNGLVVEDQKDFFICRKKAATVVLMKYYGDEPTSFAILPGKARRTPLFSLLTLCLDSGRPDRDVLSENSRPTSSRRGLSKISKRDKKEVGED